MGASSATGTGKGYCRKPTVKDLANQSQGPQILVSGRIEAIESISSPPSDTAGVVRFPYPLPGDSDNYVVTLTGLGITGVYVGQMLEENGNFVGFIALAEDAGQAMYIVTKIGQKPSTL